jgi:SAM-dependent methyltransferase
VSAGRLLRGARRLVAPIRPVLYRTRPFSTWGLERGTPVDRWYIEAFLAAHRADIHGRVVEVKDGRYTDRFGAGVSARDVIDVDERNPQATIVCDLAGDVPTAQFDCFLLTQTLQYVSDPRRAVENVHRLLAPAGVVLASLPSIIRVESQARETDRWRFTEASCRELFGTAFGPDRVQVSAAGNLAAAVGFLLGMAAEELGATRLGRADPDFPVVVLVRAVKGDPGPGR